MYKDIRNTTSSSHVWDRQELTKIICNNILLAITPSCSLHASERKDKQENKNSIQNYQKCIHQFHYTRYVRKVMRLIRENSFN